MKHRQRVLAGLLLAAGTLAGPARADDLAACNAALVHGQELRRAGRLIEARAAHPGCLRETCDTAVRSVCANFLAELATRVPSLQVDVHFDRPESRIPRVFLDGLLVSDPAQPAEVDPGEHVVRVEMGGYVTKEQHLWVKEGERPRTILVALTPSPEVRESIDAPRTPAVRPGIPASVYVLGGVSAAGLASFAYFGLRGKSTESDLRATCPTGPCETGSMRREYLAADISALVAVVAAGAALWIALTHDAGSSNASPALRARGHGSRDGGSSVDSRSF